MKENISKPPSPMQSSLQVYHVFAVNSIPEMTKSGVSAGVEKYNRPPRRLFEGRELTYGGGRGIIRAIAETARSLQYKIGSGIPDRWGGQYGTVEKGMLFRSAL